MVCGGNEVKTTRIHTTIANGNQCQRKTELTFKNELMLKKKTNTIEAPYVTPSVTVI